MKSFAFSVLARFSTDFSIKLFASFVLVGIHSSMTLSFEMRNEEIGHFKGKRTANRIDRAAGEAV